MRIASISIRKLFGVFDYHIPLRTEERITLLHGPNGVGKTTILRMVDDVFSRKFYNLSRIPFDQLKIETDEGSFITINRRIAEKNDQKYPVVSISIPGARQKHEINLFETLHLFGRQIPMAIVDDVVPYLERVAPRRWQDKRTGEILSLEEVLQNYGHLFPQQLRGKLMGIPKEVSEFLGLFTTHFIQTQRLTATPERDDYRSPSPKQPKVTVVEKNSDDMVERIQQALQQSGATAASLDRTFPMRILQLLVPKEATEENIRMKYQEQTVYRGRLMAAGLIDTGESFELPSGPIDANARKVLWYYLNDIDDKLAVFDALLKKMELFKEIINKRFLFKTFSIDLKDGFLFKSVDGKPIPLTALSSGEQHELILSYDLIFRVEPQSLIMIDEPELSLHVTWQHRFLDDMERISKLSDLDFLIATHSPQIIHHRKQLSVALKGGRDE